MAESTAPRAGPTPIFITWKSVAAICLGLVFLWVLVLTQRQTTQLNDNFLALYSAAKLLGTGELYNPDALYQIEQEFGGEPDETHRFARPPFYALGLWPLTLVSYPATFLIWRLLTLASVIGFVFVWARPSRTASLTACVLSLPLLLAIAQGQDTPFLLLFIALMVRDAERGRDLEAGLWLSLCAIKFHLFLLVPLVIVAQKRLRIVGGLGIGAAALFVVSFVAGGLSWPLDLFKAATAPGFSSSPHLMPNIYGLVGAQGVITVGEICGAALAGAVVWFGSARWDFPTAIACGLAASLLTSRHAYLPDAVLLIPAGLAVFVAAKKLPARIAALVLLAPPSYLLGGEGYAMGILVGMVLLFLILAMVDSFSEEALASKTAPAPRSVFREFR